MMFVSFDSPRLFAYDRRVFNLRHAVYFSFILLSLNLQFSS